MIGAKNEKFSISGNYAMAALGGRMCKNYIWMQILDVEELF